MQFKKESKLIEYTHEGYLVRLEQTNNNLFTAEILDKNKVEIKRFFNIKSIEGGLSRCKEFIDNNLVNKESKKQLTRQEQINNIAINILQNTIKDIQNGDNVEDIDYNNSIHGVWLEINMMEDAYCKNLTGAVLQKVGECR